MILFPPAGLNGFPDKFWNEVAAIIFTKDDSQALRCTCSSGMVSFAHVIPLKETLNKTAKPGGHDHRCDDERYHSELQAGGVCPRAGTVLQAVCCT